MDLHTESIKSPTLWVQFPNLDVKYWGLESLSKIRSIIGTPVKTYRYTKGKTMINYARLLIEVALEGSFLYCIDFSMKMKC